MKPCNRVLSNDNTVIALSLGILAMYIGVDITNFEDGDKEQIKVTMHHNTAV